jgi:hypothetical protein
VTLADGLRDAWRSKSSSRSTEPGNEPPAKAHCSWLYAAVKDAMTWMHSQKNGRASDERLLAAVLAGAALHGSDTAHADPPVTDSGRIGLCLAGAETRPGSGHPAS